MITDNNEVVCSAQEFNKNHKFLNRLKTEASKLNHPSHVVLTNSSKKSQNTFKRVFQNNKISKKDDIEGMQKAKLFLRIKSHENRSKRIDIMKNLKKKEMKERGLYRNLEIIKKQAYVLEKRKE